MKDCLCYIRLLCLHLHCVKSSVSDRDFSACVGDSYDHCLPWTEEGICYIWCDVLVLLGFISFWNIATLYVCLTCSWGKL